MYSAYYLFLYEGKTHAKLYCNSGNTIFNLIRALFAYLIFLKKITIAAAVKRGAVAQSLVRLAPRL